MFSVGASCPVSSHRRMSLSSAWLGSSNSSTIRQFRFPDTAVLQGRAAIRRNYVWKEKAEYFGSDLKTEVTIEGDVVEPGGKIKGHFVIDTKFPIEHDGIFIEVEALCSLNYSTKHNERTTVHKGKGCILENTKVNPFGHLESPIKCEIVPITPPEFGGHSINSGVWHYPFELEIPCDSLLPRPFEDSQGTLDYKLLVHMISHSSATYVKLSEVQLKCEGHYNLHYESVEAIRKPIVVEQYYRKSYFSQKKLVKATLTLINGGGFLHEEEVPFTLMVKNPKCLTLRVEVNFLKNVKYQANTNLASVVKVVEVVESLEMENRDEQVEPPKQEILWKGTFRIPEYLPPSYTCNSMYSVSYCVEFQIKSLEELIISGQANILLGTTREPFSSTSTTDLHHESGGGGGGAGGGELHRSGSESSLHSQRSVYSGNKLARHSVPANLNLSVDDEDEDEDENNLPSSSSKTAATAAGTAKDFRVPSTSSASYSPSPSPSPSPRSPNAPLNEHHPNYTGNANEPSNHSNNERTDPAQEASSSPRPSSSSSFITSATPTMAPPYSPTSITTTTEHGGVGGGGSGALNFPPSYSQLSSRIPSTETLPPTYSNLDLTVEHLHHEHEIIDDDRRNDVEDEDEIEIDGDEDDYDDDEEEDEEDEESSITLHQHTSHPHSTSCTTTSTALFMIDDDDDVVDAELEKRLSINLNTLNLVEAADDQYSVTFYSV